MRSCRTFLFILDWTLLTLVLGVVGVWLLPFKRASAGLIRSWNHISLLQVRYLLGISVRFEGEVAEKPVVYASKHQSTLETLALFIKLRAPAFVLKRELLRIPIFGWFLARTAPIAIDRSKGAQATQQIAEQGRARLEAGRNVVIFPEGTRRSVGAAPRYKAGGVWALYEQGYQVVPVALNTGWFWPKKGEKRAGEAVIRFLEPLANGLTKEAMIAQLQERVEANTNALYLKQ